MNHRVAIVSSTLSHDHPLLYDELALPLHKSGWRVEIINPRFEGSDKNRIRFRRLPLEGNSIFKTRQKWRLITESLLKSRADVCILHEPMLLPLIPKIKKLMPVQTAFLLFSPQQTTFLQRVTFGKAFLSRFLPFADSVMVKTEEQAQLLEQLGVRAEVISDADSLSELCEKLEERGRYNV
ncbi:MAG: hypothetical protein J6C75_00465 [Oscillospiraceae bacterium]|nr:hypothetical protein [Oscillospiraceae bacterium]